MYFIGQSSNYYVQPLPVSQQLCPSSIICFFCVNFPGLYRRKSWTSYSTQRALIIVTNVWRGNTICLYYLLCCHWRKNLNSLWVHNLSENIGITEKTRVLNYWKHKCGDNNCNIFFQRIYVQVMTGAQSIFPLIMWIAILLKFLHMIFFRSVVQINLALL